MNDVETRLLQQSIYDELEKEPPSEKVREYFKAVPYHMRKEVKHGKNRDIHEKQGGRSALGAGSDPERGEP